MEEIKRKTKSIHNRRNFEIDDDPDFTDDVHLFNEVCRFIRRRLK